MKEFREYWTFSAIRGAMTILAAFFIVLIPQGMVSLMGLPRPLGLAVDSLATYCVIDAVVIILLAILMPKQAIYRKALYLRVAAGVFFAGVFYLQVLNPAPGRLMVWAAVFALVAAASELGVALDTHREYHCLSCYANAAVLTACAFALPFAQNLDVEGMCTVLGGFVAVYGLSQLVVGARMLFLEYRQNHPATVLSEDWKLAMVGPAKACTSCAECPALAACSDNSVEGQIAQVWAQRHPAIVRAMKMSHMVAVSGSR